jgi:hypothetical protein
MREPHNYKCKMTNAEVGDLVIGDFASGILLARFGIGHLPFAIWLER